MTYASTSARVSLGAPMQCSNGQQALARFQNKKKERAVKLLRVAKLRGPQRRRNSSGESLGTEAFEEMFVASRQKFM